MLRYLSYLRNLSFVHGGENSKPMSPEKFEKFTKNFDLMRSTYGSDFCARLEESTRDDINDIEFYMDMLKKYNNDKLTFEQTVELFDSFIVNQDLNMASNYGMVYKDLTLEGFKTIRDYYLKNSGIASLRKIYPHIPSKYKLYMSAVIHARGASPEEHVLVSRINIGKDVYLLVPIEGKSVYIVANFFTDFDEFDEDMPEKLQRTFVLRKPVIKGFNLYALSTLQNTRVIAYIDMSSGILYDCDLLRRQDWKIYDKVEDAKRSILFN